LRGSAIAGAADPVESRGRMREELMLSEKCSGVLVFVACLLVLVSAYGAIHSAEHPLYLAIIWHQHQPIYPVDEQGYFSKPWVRMHSVKDYYDMCAILQEYPDIHCTFNLTPSLLKQIEEFLDGKRDIYWVLSEKQAKELTRDEKAKILERFFDANWPNLIDPNPRYRELLDKRGRSYSPEVVSRALEKFTTQDFVDLQVWFNLAWLDPDFKRQEPARTLVAKGRNFTEADKKALLDMHLEIMKEVIPVHRKLQDAGQIEVTFTPYAHPILPLIYDTNLARVALPGIDLPTTRFSYPEDAEAHVEKGIAYYMKCFGKKPQGMWPAEGSVAQEIVPIVAKAGVGWMASDEEVLERSLNTRLKKDSLGRILNGEVLYQPYVVSDGEKEVAMVFRDRALSDRVGFNYSKMPAAQAVADFQNRLHFVRDQLKGKQGPFLVSVILDGENCWENYPNDGKEFLHGLYQMLSRDKSIETVTPSEFLLNNKPRSRIQKLWAGSWINATYDIWIGEREENIAWVYLAEAREALARYASRPDKDPARLSRAFEAMYSAEGSDWFWWYGADMDSGDDASFDMMFRNLLVEVYRAIEEEAPVRLYVPIVSQWAWTPAKEIVGQISPVVDGVAEAKEWENAGCYRAVPGGVMQAGEKWLNEFWYGYDTRNLYIRADFARDLPVKPEDIKVVLALGSESAKKLNLVPTPEPSAIRPAGVREEVTNAELGYGLSHEVVVTAFRPPLVNLYIADGGERWERKKIDISCVSSGRTLEFSIPFSALGLVSHEELRANILVFRGVEKIDALPSPGTAKLVVPELGLDKPLVDVIDATGDDYGPGTYVYPSNAVFVPGSFDIQRFSVYSTKENVIFQVRLGSITNPWNSPVGLSLQILDVYIDSDPGKGRKALLPGRGAYVEEGSRWDYAVTVDGWEQSVYAGSSSGEPVKIGAPQVKVNEVERTVNIYIPKQLVSFDASKAGYLCVVMGQDGYAPPSMWKVRSVQSQATEWQFGGAKPGYSAPNIIDIALPQQYDQRKILGTYQYGKQVEIPLVR